MNKLQVHGQVGGLGFDCEFLENAMVYNYVPDVLLNLDATKAYTLTIAPTLPEGMTKLNVYNLIYDGIVYDLKITNDSVEITNVRGETTGRTVTLRSPSGKTQTFDFGACKLEKTNAKGSTPFPLSNKIMEKNN